MAIKFTSDDDFAVVVDQLRPVQIDGVGRLFCGREFSDVSGQPRLEAVAVWSSSATSYGSSLGSRASHDRPRAISFRPTAWSGRSWISSIRLTDRDGHATAANSPRSSMSYRMRISYGDCIA